MKWSRIPHLIQILANEISTKLKVNWTQLNCQSTNTHTQCIYQSWYCNCECGCCVYVTLFFSLSLSIRCSVVLNDSLCAFAFYPTFMYRHHHNHHQHAYRTSVKVAAAFTVHTHRDTKRETVLCQHFIRWTCIFCHIFHLATMLPPLLLLLLPRINFECISFFSFWLARFFRCASLSVSLCEFVSVSSLVSLAFGKRRMKMIPSMLLLRVCSLFLVCSTPFITRIEKVSIVCVRKCVYLRWMYVGVWMFVCARVCVCLSKDDVFCLGKKRSEEKNKSEQKARTK